MGEFVVYIFYFLDKRGAKPPNSINMQPRFHSDKIWEQKLEDTENKRAQQFDILRQRHYKRELHLNTFEQLLAGNFLMPTV
jgi:hypothetical protein